ncbi:hypothetical protein, partial [Haliea salexigens]|uniref:hypothetical protein n=1 Tax=Haliea salexigens TaxID=287487 RepID=UPI0005598940
MPKPQSELPENQVTPNPGLEKRTRRQFSTEYKLKILAEADACQHGEIGALLRPVSVNIVARSFMQNVSRPFHDQQFCTQHPAQG